MSASEYDENVRTREQILSKLLAQTDRLRLTGEELIFEDGCCRVAIRPTVGNRVTITLWYDGQQYGQLAGVPAEHDLLRQIIEGAVRADLGL